MPRYVAMGAVLFGLLTHGNTEASKPSEEGWEQFGVSLAPTKNVGSDGSWRVMVWAWSESDSLHGTVATVRLEPGPNLECAAEHRSKTVPLGPTGAGTMNWPVTMMTTGDGPRHITATIRIGHPGGPAIDEQEVRLDVTIREGSVHVERHERIHATRVEHGQRFRYGGKYLVAIDRSEKERPRMETRPVLKREVAATCPKCSADSQRVNLVVTVGRSGRITWIRPRRQWETQIGPEILTAATRAASKWRFTPAMAGGKSVADWTNITMLVVR